MINLSPKICDAGDIGTSRSKKICSIWDFERLCRETVSKSPKHSNKSVLLFLHASTVDGWIPTNKTAVSFGFVPASNFNNWAIEGGFLESRIIRMQGEWEEHQIKLMPTINLVDQDSVDGRIMLRIFHDLKFFSRAHTLSTPLIALALSAIHTRKIDVVADIGRFLLGDDVYKNPSYAPKIINQLCELGLVQIIKTKEHGSKLLVYPTEAGF